MHVKIIEEVPGVPRDEQYFVSYLRNGHRVTKFFSTSDEAKLWCEDQGFTHEVVPFLP